MGIFDKINLWLTESTIKRVVKKARKIAKKSTETMIESSIAKSLFYKNQGKSTGRSDIVSGLIETRPFWKVDKNGNILNKGAPTGKNINTEDTMSLVKYVVITEFTFEYAYDLLGYDLGIKEINNTIDELFNENNHLTGEELHQSPPIKSKDISDYIVERINEYDEKRKTKPASELFIKESELFNNLTAKSKIEKESIRWCASSFIEAFNSSSQDLIIKSDINTKNMDKAEMFRKQILEPSLLGKDMFSDEREITIATKKLFSDILDNIYDSKLGLDINAKDTVIILAESYCLCLFAKTGFTHDSQILQNMHEYSKKDLLAYINSILSTNREKEYYDLEMNKITEQMIDNIPSYYESRLKNLKDFVAEINLNGLTAMNKHDELTMVGTILSKYVIDNLKVNYGVDSKMCSHLSEAIQNIGIQVAFQIAGLEINGIN